MSFAREQIEKVLKEHNPTIITCFHISKPVVCFDQIDRQTGKVVSGHTYHPTIASLKRLIHLVQDPDWFTYRLMHNCVGWVATPTIETALRRVQRTKET